MPLLEEQPPTVDVNATEVSHEKLSNLVANRQSQHSVIAKTAIMTQHVTKRQEDDLLKENPEVMISPAQIQTSLIAPNAKGVVKGDGYSNGRALTDTPLPTPGNTAPSSPRIPVLRKESGGNTPRSRPTTLDIPGLTKSRVSPDGRIAQRDIGSKLVIVMVGLPARGKSYVTKKICRYLNWLQHDTKIFNVGERRRVVAGGPNSITKGGMLGSFEDAADKDKQEPAQIAAKLLLNDYAIEDSEQADMLPPPAIDSNFVSSNNVTRLPDVEAMKQDADFFDPDNTKGALIREQVALATLEDLLDYILDQNGSVGIFDATNSTLERRKMIMNRIRERAGSELNVLFLESVCEDQTLLESNMRLKLSGPDYKDQDPVKALDDFRKRVELYKKAYVPLGEYEENNDMPYVQIIDVGRKVVSHQIRGFLSAQTVYYLLNFNLSPRQIWITRHGESTDNVNGKIGGDSDLSLKGHAFAKALTKFIGHERQAWEVHQEEKARSTHFPPLPGDTTPPNPEYTVHTEVTKNFCVWTSMLKRSVETGQYFDEEDFDVKQMRMLDELYAGTMEGMTYEEIKLQHHEEYERRLKDKLRYRYPGPGGEGYLDIINRLRAVIVEIERMTDHVLLIGHRSVARVLLAYFKGLKREDVADLDVPLGMLYMLEPKPYGVDFKAYRYNDKTDWFDYVPDYELRPSTCDASS